MQIFILLEENENVKKKKLKTLSLFDHDFDMEPKFTPNSRNFIFVHILDAICWFL